MWTKLAKKFCRNGKQMSCAEVQVNGGQYLHNTGLFSESDQLQHSAHHHCSAQQNCNIEKNWLQIPN